MNENSDFFQDLIKNTLFDTDLANRFLPLQFWEEYEKQRNSLDDFVKNKNAKIVLLLPFEKPQLNLPLVLLFIWSKASSLLNMEKYSSKTDIKWIYTPLMHKILEKDSSANIIKILKKLNIQSSKILTTKLRDQIDTNEIIGPAAVRFIEKYLSQQKEITEEAIANLLNAVCLVSYTIICPGNIILCGQDRAPMYNTIAKHLREEAELEPSSFPTGLFIPLVNFPDGYHIGLFEAKESVFKKIHLILTTLSSRQSQVNWAIDATRFTNYVALNESFEDYMKQIEMCDNLFDISSLCTKRIDDWKTFLMK